MQKRPIDPSEWNDYLSGFSDRNNGRRARFEAFTVRGVAEEDEEAKFHNVSMDNGTAVIDRLTSRGKPITDKIENVRGITTQLDSDESENTMEFVDSDGNMTVLHFESLVDGES